MNTPAMQSAPPRLVSRKTLLTISAIADALDFAGGGILVGPWSLIIDVPVTILHFLYAGPRAAIVLAEYIPLVGLVPFYSIAAASYDKAPKPPPVVDAEIVTEPPPSPTKRLVL